MSKVSVIVPIYDTEKYLKECVDSILSQTLCDIEVILVDDGSPDNCPQMCADYAERDERIRVIHKQNGGYGSAVNTGLNMAQGEYISIVEPDDYIAPKMYEDLYKIAKDNNSDIVKSCFYVNLQINGKFYCKKTKWNVDEIPKTTFTASECPLFLYYHPSIWSCIYKREFIENNNIRFIEFPGAGWTDNPFQVQTMCLAKRINYTDEAYYYWRRLNRDESDDLKDFTIPFKRSDEIHKWLEEKNITDEKILFCLYRREFAYITIALGSISFGMFKDLKILIKKMLDRIDVDILKKNGNKSVIKEYFIFRDRLFCRFFKIQFLKIRRKVISMRINRHELAFVLFGFYIFYREGKPNA